MSESPPKSILDESRLHMAVGGILALAGLILLIRMGHQAWPFTVDDAFITLRYSRNLAEGFGPTFNPDPPPVEGYSSFLFMILAVIPHLLGTDPVLFVKGTAILGTAGTVVTTALLALQLGRAPSSRPGPSADSGRFVIAGFAVFLLCTFHATAVHAVSGMETSLAAFLLTALLWAVLTAKPSWLGPLIGLLLGLCRPEANLVIPAVLVWQALRAPRQARQALVSFLVYVLPGALYFFGRWAYYGHFLPIPFYAKVTNEPGLGGLASTLLFGQTLLVHLGLLLALALMGSQHAKAKAPGGHLARSPFFLLLGSGILWNLGCLMPSPVMDFDWRYCYPTAPLFFAVAACGLGVAMEHLAPLRRPRLGLGVLVVLAAAAQWAAFAPQATTTIRERRAYGEALRAGHMQLGLLLASFRAIQGGSPLLAIGDAGAVPYYSGWRAIDIAGLNDPLIGIENRHDPDAVLSRSPDLVILASQKSNQFVPNVFFPWEQDLYTVALQRGYVRLGMVPFSGGCFLWILGREESPIGVFLRAEAQRHRAERGG